MQGLWWCGCCLPLLPDPSLSPLCLCTCHFFCLELLLAPIGNFPFSLPDPAPVAPSVKLPLNSPLQPSALTGLHRPGTHRHSCTVTGCHLCQVVCVCALSWGLHVELWLFTGRPESERVSHSVLSHSAVPWTVACQVPLSLGFSRQEYCCGSHSLLQGIFLTQGSNPGLPHCRQILY